MAGLFLITPCNPDSFHRAWTVWQPCVRVRITAAFPEWVDIRHRARTNNEHNH